MLNEFNSQQNNFKSRLKRLGEELLETGAEWLGEKTVDLLDEFTAKKEFEAWLSKDGVSEYPLNDCRVAATPEQFRELKFIFKIHNMSAEAIDDFARGVIDKINNCFDYEHQEPLSSAERQAIKKLIREKFRQLKLKQDN